MYILRKHNHRAQEYLTYDEIGEKAWTKRMIDATRFNTPKEIKQVCLSELKNGGSTYYMGLNGNVVFYKGYEIQMYRKGKKWKHRISFYKDGKLVHRYGKNGLLTYQQAYNEGKHIIDLWETPPATTF